MLWFKAFHVICMVCWFAGLFYLPRLYVYHAATNDPTVRNQFKIMEHKLYWYITTPAAILTGIFGALLWLPNYDYYSHLMWMHVKLVSVLILYFYHIYLGVLLNHFKLNQNKHSEKFYRYLNEIPSIILVLIVVMVIVKPF